jgi:hypothetical protein
VAAPLAVPLQPSKQSGRIEGFLGSATPLLFPLNPRNISDATRGGHGVPPYKMLCGLMDRHDHLALAAAIKLTKKDSLPATK